MVPGGRPPRERILDPVSRISEILFGLIMALTFTTAVAAAGDAGEARLLLTGVLGCNIAWGLVDGVMYLMEALAGRGRGVLIMRAVRDARDPADAERVIRSAVTPMMASLLTAEDVDRVRQGILRLERPPAPSLTRDDWLGALGVCLLVILSTFPVVIPFFFVADPQLATRLSNLVAIVMLFACGVLLGRHSGYPPWRAGLSMVVLGLILVGIAIAFEA
jgi:hypothetical protein